MPFSSGSSLLGRWSFLGSGFLLRAGGFLLSRGFLGGGLLLRGSSGGFLRRGDLGFCSLLRAGFFRGAFFSWRFFSGFLLRRFFLTGVGELELVSGSKTFTG